MLAVRFSHAAALLLDGRVLVCGGSSSAGGVGLTSCEVFNPSTNQWAPRAPMMVGRSSFSMIRLADGRLLASGGSNATNAALGSAELYSPVANTWSLTPVMPSARLAHVMLPLADGGIVAIAGTNGTVIINAVDVYRPSSNTWVGGSAMNDGHREHNGLVLADGTLLVSGGNDGTGVLMRGERLVGDTWVPTGPTATGHLVSNSAQLASGDVLLIGGFDGNTHGRCELWSPVTNGWTDAGSLAQPRYYHRVVTLLDGRLLVVGGQVDGATALASTELYPVVTTPVAVLDAGAPVDGGTMSDGGTPIDAGTAVDAGAPDAGTPVDAGTAVDAGTSVDAGTPVDAGTLDAGLEMPRPEPPPQMARSLTVSCSATSDGATALLALVGVVFVRARLRSDGRTARRGCG